MKYLKQKIAIISLVLTAIVTLTVANAGGQTVEQRQTSKIDPLAAIILAPKKDLQPTSKALPIPKIAKAAPLLLPLDNRLSPDQQAWVRKLELCESGGHPGSLNAKDRDGTASYGILQFKPGTFYGYAKRYGVPVTNYKDPGQQESVLTEMILHAEQIDWHHQFPDCTRKLGMPPTK